MANTVLQKGQYYHIFNRGTNSEILFKREDNYPYFLELYAKYVDPVAETLAYCLMKTHFHLLIRTKEEHEIKTFTELGMFEKEGIPIVSDKKPRASNQFGHLFNAYSKSINDAHKRTGSLFEHPFERRLIDNENYLRNCIAYIHFNPVKARYVTKPEEYKWSSFRSLTMDKPTKLNRDLVMKLFDGRENFLRFHEKDSEMFDMF